MEREGKDGGRGRDVETNPFIVRMYKLASYICVYIHMCIYVHVYVYIFINMVGIIHRPYTCVYTFAYVPPPFPGGHFRELVPCPGHGSGQ